MKSTLSLLALAGMLWGRSGAAQSSDDWPQFRGPNGDGISSATNVPLTWSPTQNVKWKVPVPGRGRSSPVLLGDRVWLTTAWETNVRTFDEGPDRMQQAERVVFGVVCLDRATGKQLYRTELFTVTNPAPVNLLNSYATPTPVVESGRVYCDFGTFGTACLDSASGEALWKRQLPVDHRQGPGSSPALYKNLLILVRDGTDRQYVTALDKQTGNAVWKTDRPPFRTPVPIFKKSFSTPLVFEAAGKTQMVVPGAQWFVSYDPETGNEIWRVDDGRGETVAPRPVYGDGLVYLSTGVLGGRAQLWAVRVGGVGNVTETQVAWKLPNAVGFMASPLLVKRELYLLSDDGVLTCVDASSGEVLGKAYTLGKCAASPVYAEGRVYCFTREGKTVVFQPGGKLTVLAQNQLDGPVFGSPAFTHSAIYVRTDSHLYCLASGPQTPPSSPALAPAPGAASAPPKTFIDYFLPTPPQGALSSDVWGATNVLPRDPKNGLEDATVKQYCYWDGQILKGPEGKYHLFASRWAEPRGHDGWFGSVAVHAVSDSLLGPYTDQGLCWPNDQGGKGHNVGALALPDGRYAVYISETRPCEVYVSKSLDGPWEHLGTITVEGEPRWHASNVVLLARPDGAFEMTQRDGCIFTSDRGIIGPYKRRSGSVFPKGIPNLEDPCLWYSGGLYHILVNSWSTRKAYHLTSRDGIHDWIQRGVAYDPREAIVRYPDGVVNRWNKVERPSVYIENGHVAALTLAAIDVEKERDKGGDGHGSKVIVIPFDGVALDRDLELAAERPKHADGAGAYATGNYRNLFAEIGKSQAEIRRKIDAAFQQLFHGDPTNEAIYYEAGTNAAGTLAFVTDIKHRDVRSEGLSYGMIIAAELNKKAEFDAIWNWSKTYLYVSETNHPSYGFFAWQARTNGVRMSQFVAPDGEEYYVTALYLAARRWGNGTGMYNYQEQADELLSRMRHRPVINGSVPWFGRARQVKAGPLFDEEQKMVLFSPSDERSRFTDPSYHLPAFYELWSRWGPKEDAAFWSQAAEVSRDFFVKATHPVSGLNPCYANFDGSLVARSGSYGTNFSYDAFRTAGNWSVDWSWWGKDPRQRELSDKLQAFFASQGTNYGCVFTLEGKPLETRHAQGLVAVNAVSSLAATHPRWKSFVEELWNTPTPDGLERYYEGLLYLMALLHCGGEFRIW